MNSLKRIIEITVGMFIGIMLSSGAMMLMGGYYGY